MTSEERERMNELFQQIVIEKDHETLATLVAELKDLLGSKRIHPEHTSKILEKTMLKKPSGSAGSTIGTVNERKLDSHPRNA